MTFLYIEKVFHDYPMTSPLFHRSPQSTIHYVYYLPLQKAH